MGKIAFWMNELLRQIGIKPEIADFLDKIIILILIILVAIISDLVCRVLFLGIVRNIVRRTKNQWDDMLLDKKILNKLALIVPAILIYILVPLAFNEETHYLVWIRKFCAIYIIAVSLRFLNGLLNVTMDITSQSERFKERPLKGLFQILQVILFFIGGIVIISVLIDKSPTTLFAGLGASAAILMLVFKDTIVGFVSGIQLSANNMLHVGDWITMPKYEANGYVIEITLNTVKVRNFDNTITTIPPYALVSDSFQNWRGMQESGGRRIKRSINIDMNSVRFCTQEMLEKYRKISLLKDYIEEKEKILNLYNEEHHIDNSILVNGRRQTNIGVFRAYLEKYIEHLPDINNELTHMVRQLQPTEKGIPIEIYFFSAEKNWILYEKIQADVFDHVLAIVPEFDLYVFQNPSGKDLNKLRNDD